MIARMNDEDKPKSFEETLRAIADEVTRGMERVQQGDLEDVARAYGLDPDRARSFIDRAGSWLRTQADSFSVTVESWPDPLRAAGPDPLDVPTDEQGRALAALDSGRWVVEPGTSMLVSRGEGPAPSDALGLVRELRVRDWIDADGQVTLAGHAALKRWLT
jgi:hypothetical protein